MFKNTCRGCSTIMFNLVLLTNVSINTQVIKQNRRSHWLAISDYHPIITSTDKMAASSRFATVSEDDFALKCFFFSLF